MTLFRQEAVVGSPEQEAFWKALTDNDSHVVLEARAGTGKTFSCIEGCKRMLEADSSLNIAMVAYNKSIASELEQKVPAGVTACTMHSLGKGAIYSNCGKHKVSGYKTQDILKKILGENEFKNVGWHFVGLVKKAVSLAKNTMLPLDFNEGEWSSMVDHYSLDMNDSEARIRELTRLILKKSVEQTNVIDFDDMIWLPVVLDLKVTKFDVLFVDEAQDLNKSRQQLAVKAGERIVIVGDPKQAIYGFAGADAYSMRNMSNMLGEVITLPLTVTRRCPKSHVELAQSIVSDIKPMEGAKEGTIKRIKTPELFETAEVGDMILCRTNAPLMSAAYGFITRDIPCMIQGRDIGAGLNSLIKKLCGKNFKSTDVLTLESKLDDYLVKEIAKLDQKRLNAPVSDMQYDLLNDKVSCIRLISQGLQTVGEVCDRITELFSDTDSDGMPQSKVVLSSIHRAKGLEADNVFILHPEKLPHPMATLEWEIEQEYNIKYVAITRSMDTLYFVETEND
jgi:superfamily I DNA/RNA helicase